MTNALYLQIGDSGTTVSLITGTLKVRSGAWSMRAPDPMGDWNEQAYGAQYSFKKYQRITETFDMVAVDTAANIRTGVKAIEDMLEKARLWHTRKLVTQNPIWLVAQSEGETARRSLVYGGSLRFSGVGKSSPLLEGSAVGAQLVIQRHPLWENTTVTTFGDDDTTHHNCLGGKWTPASSALGTAPGRINDYSVYPHTGDTISRLWVGVRDNGQGSTDFDNLWECESGTAGTDASIASDSGNCSPSGSTTNNMVKVVWATATNAKRLTVSVHDVWSGTDKSDMIGRYLVLLRAKVPSGTNVVFQLRYGYTSNADAAHRIANTVYYAGTGANYRIIELGEITIPAARLFGNPIDVDYTQIQLWAECVSSVSSPGTDVNLDALVLVPCEHMFKVSDLQSLTVDQLMTLSTNPDDTTIAYTNESSVIRTVECASRDFYWSTEGVVAVVVGEGESAHVLDDVVFMVATVYPRHLSYRTA